MNPSTETVPTANVWTSPNSMTGWRWWFACLLVFVGALVATVPTTGDLGLTWDEPAYRHSQLRSAEWWRRLAQVRSRADLEALLDPTALLYYWTYARYGINFHPPLAGQLNLLTHALFGHWMKDIPSRRMSSVIEYSLTITILFGFLARRYGLTVGLVAGGSLLLMPRVYGDAHIAATDIPGLFLWGATALAFWNGLYQPNARGWRVLVGVLLGLAFVEKMAAVFVVWPLLLWLVIARVPRSFTRKGGPGDWVDGLVSSGAMLVPLGLAFLEILRLTKELPLPKYTDLFSDHPPTTMPGAILAVPLLVWFVRCGLGRVFPRNKVWGVERPGLETWTAILAFAPVVGWLGNPAWWRETLPRLAHYYMINTNRRGSLPDIQILYFGQGYEYSLPWHNGWVLIAITVPATILAAAVIGLLVTPFVVRHDRLPLYFIVHLLALPGARMLSTPAHDGVRLMLPAFFCVAAFAGWGAIWLADGVGRRLHARRLWPFHAAAAALVLLPAGWQLVKVHPFELSYYNELIGGPRGAWKAGFELAYWYDAFNPHTLKEINARLPKGAVVVFRNEKSTTSTFQELQALGELRGDLVLNNNDPTLPNPFVWLLTQDSKSTAFTRALYVMTPWYAVQPPQLDGLRVATVADPVSVSRAYALWLMLDARADRQPEPPRTPKWVKRYAPFLGRFWGEGLVYVAYPTVNKPLLNWARNDPRSLLRAARVLSERREAGDDPDAQRLLASMERLTKYGAFVKTLLRTRPEAILEAAQILTERADDVEYAMTRYPYTDLADIDGPIDQGLPVYAHL
jgi:hypothetical protein